MNALVTSMKRTVLVATMLASVAASLSVLASASGASERSAAGTGNPYSAAAMPRLARLVNEFAARNGDANPMSIGAVATTRGTALAVSGGDRIAAGNAEPVYLVSMQGHFTAYAAKTPSSTRRPRGEYLFVVIDRRTFRVLDYGIGPRPARLPAADSCWTPIP